MSRNLLHRLPLIGGPASDRASESSSPATDTLGSRLSEFRSLGGNCEFGFVQRYSGIEPSGLLRFAFTPIADLIHALDSDFSEYGAPGDLRLEITDSNTYYCASNRYDIWSNTGFQVGSIRPEELLEKEYSRIRYLKSKLLAELASGSKILVRKMGTSETRGERAALAHAIARHGSSALLWIDETGPDWQPEPVTEIAERVFFGTVRKFAPQETAWDVDLEPWIRACESAYALIFRTPETSFYPDRRYDELHFPQKLRKNKSQPSNGPINSYVRSVDAAGFDPRKVYVFSSWVWIPSATSPERILALAGHEPLRSRDADLTIRDRWQRVWAAGTFQQGRGPAAVGLGMVGGKQSYFWSRGARFHEGPVPRPDSAPAPLGHGLIRWLNSF